MRVDGARCSTAFIRRSNDSRRTVGLMSRPDAGLPDGSYGCASSTPAPYRSIAQLTRCPRTLGPGVQSARWMPSCRPGPPPAGILAAHDATAGIMGAAPIMCVCIYRYGSRVSLRRNRPSNPPPSLQISGSGSVSASSQRQPYIP